MGSFLRQVTIVATINLRCILQRTWLSLSTLLAIALVVGVLLSFLALAAGFRQTLANAGSPDVAIIMRPGAQAEINSVVMRDQVHLIDTAPGIARDPGGHPMISAELFLAVDAFKRSDGSKTSVTLRGIGGNGLKVRRAFSIVQGRMFQPGTREIVVGRSLATTIRNLDVGATVELGRHPWLVVGTFEADGSVFESEVWADQRVVGTTFKRNSIFQTVRVRLDDPGALSGLARFVDGDPRLKLEVRSEAQYYADQAEQSSQLIDRIGWPLALFMAIGALAGTISTMYSSVEARERDIATLRAIGFGRLPAFLGTIVESVVLATAGGLLGAMVVALLLHSAKTSVVGSNVAQIVVNLRLGPRVLCQGIVLAVGMGLLGGLLPAVRSTRDNVAAAFGK